MSTHSRNPAGGPPMVGDEPGAGLLDALVAAERDSMDPPAEGERQTWERVVASVAVGGTPPVQPSSISGPASTVTSLWIKIVLGVVIGGVVAAAGYRLSAEPEPVATTVARSNGAAPQQQQAQPPSTPSVAPRAQPHPPAQPAAVVPPQPPTQSPQPPPSKPTRVVPPDTPPTSDLTEETRLLARARALVRAGSPGDALAPLREHARRFPEGQLTEDRLVLQAQALCESGDNKAGLKKATALRKAFPGSSHLPRVSRICSP